MSPVLLAYPHPLSEGLAVGTYLVHKHKESQRLENEALYNKIGKCLR